MTTTMLARPSTDFAVLSKRITAAGLLQRRPGYYAARLSLVGALFAGGWLAFFLIGNSWWQLVVAGALAVVYAQVALVAHDIAHRQVFRTRRLSETVGMIAGNLMIGMSYGWWMDKHTRHHANPNHEELDPDVSPDLLVWSAEQARSATGVARFIGRWQAFLFFPLLTLEGINLKVSSVRALLKPSIKHRAVEATLLAISFGTYLSALFILLSPGKAVAFLVVHQALFGVYLGSTFAPNHKGMPTLTADDELDYLRKQVLTSRNVSGGRVVDWALGGLNYQIEHHLFPSMPSPNLRKAKPIVEGYCSQIGVPYAETSLVESYALALRSLHEAGEPIRRS